MKRIVFILISFVYTYSFSCECPPYEKLTKLYTNKFDIIFTGKTDSVKNQIAYFTIEKLFKGSSIKNIFLRSADTMHCSMAFNTGETWLIYGEYLKYGELTADICSRSRRQIADNDFYATTLLTTFSDDENYLEKNLGLQNFAENKESEQYNRELIHPDRYSMLLLILFSFAGLLVVYFFIRKYL
jgi:hypothetical protein